MSDKVTTGKDPPHDNMPVCASSSLQTQMNLQLCFINNSESEEEEEEEGGEISKKDGSNTRVTTPNISS